jgi:hypothetical protein
MSDVKSTPVIYISPKIHSRIMEYAQSADGEVSGFGSVNKNTNIIDKLFPLLPQHCSGGETDMDAEFLHAFTRSGQSATYDLWWHSHSNMGVFWSGQDETCIKLLGQSMCAGGHQPRPLISIVVNKHRVYKARIDIFKPINITVEANLTFYYEFPYSEIERIRAEVKEKVKPHIYTVPNYKQVSRYPEYVPRTETKIVKHGMTEKELAEFGYKVDGTKIIKMTVEEQIQYFKLHKKGVVDGNTITGDLFGLNGKPTEVGGSEDTHPPYPPNWDSIPDTVD